MPITRWREREAVSIENGSLRLTALRSGGHIAEIFHKSAGVNPLWVPPWPTTDHPVYKGSGDFEAPLLAGIHGHNLCLDLFGTPSPEEAAAGMTVHGQGSTARYEIAESGGALTMSAELPLHGMRFTRVLRLDGETVRFHETVENLTPADRPIAYTQHVTLGPPFLEKGATEFAAPATRAHTYPSDFAGPNGNLRVNAAFDWPNAPRANGRGVVDMRRMENVERSAAFATQLMDPHRERAWFAAWSARYGLVFGYEWKRSDYPWLGIWEENNSRTHEPWNGRTLARGMEFGASPFPETRRAMIERRELFGTPAFRWLPAKSKIVCEYSAFARKAASLPEEYR